MQYHTLLHKQINKFLSHQTLEDSSIKNFILEVNESYEAFERDRELSAHAFRINEREYQEMNEHLRSEFELKKQSIHKLKTAIAKITDDQLFQLQDDDLLAVSDFLNEEILKRKKIEEEHTKTARLLTTLVSNLNSGIFMEDENRKLVFINKIFCNMFSIVAPPEVLVGIDCTTASQESMVLFCDPYGFVEKTEQIAQNRKAVTGEELELLDGSFYERNFIPIYVDDVFRGHIWNYVDITERKNSEIKLKLNQVELERLSLVASANNNGVIFTDIDGRIFWSNEGFQNLSGYSLEEIAGSTPIALGKGELTDDKVVREMIAAYKRGENFSIVVVMYRKDQSWFWANIKGQPIYEENKLTVLHYFTFIEDITKVKLQEEQIQTLSLVAEANTKGVFILNASHHYNWVNKAYENLIGFQLDELATKKPIDFLVRNAEDKEGYHLLKAAEQNEDNVVVEFIHNRKDGSCFWARLNLQFVRNIHGDVIERFGVLDDITKEKDAENALRLSEEKYRSIIANMNLGLLELDHENRIQYANQGFLRMSGFRMVDILDADINSLFESKIEGLNRLTQSAREVSDAFEITFTNKANLTKWWLVSKAAKLNFQGNVLGSIGIFLDITQQKQQEAELKIATRAAEESSMAKAAFLANMSHEIRTPLNAIIGMLRELTKTTTTTKQQGFVTNAVFSSNHLLSILNNILDISKIEAGEFQLDESHFNLVELLNETSSLLFTQAAEKGLTVQTEFDSNLAEVFLGDPGRVRQILLNLLGNAIKFTETGSVKLICSVLDDKSDLQEISFQIIDTGIGMDKEYLANLFNKFSQEDKSTARKYGGTGLGMAITNELVQLMEGRINVKSVKNKGTEVKVVLPIRKGLSSHIEEEMDATLFENLRGIKLLLVEDNEWNRLVANHTLIQYDIVVTEATNGQEAIDILAKETFDMILMDVQMPIMDGIEATMYIRDKMNIQTPIVALTANAFKREIEHCLSIGMNDFIIKPYDESVFFATLVKNINANG